MPFFWTRQSLQFALIPTPKSDTIHWEIVAASLLQAPVSGIALRSDIVCMVFEQIENLKRQYTDQFVVVDEHRPELARFRGVTGQIKTVNMNGRALVEFQDYIANIGWYDIDLEFLTVVPKPDPAAAVAASNPAAARPAAAKPAAAKPSATQPVDAKPTPAAKSPAAKAAVAKGSGAALPAATPGAAAPGKAGAKPAAGKLNTADILAAARTKKAAESAAAAAPAEAAGTAAATAAAPAESAVAVAAEPTAPAKTAAKPSAAAVNEKPTTTAEKIALCRKIDSKTE